MDGWVDGWMDEKIQGRSKVVHIYNVFKSILLLLEVQFSFQLRLMEIFVLMYQQPYSLSRILGRLGKKH